MTVFKAPKSSLFNVYIQLIKIITFNRVMSDQQS